MKCIRFHNKKKSKLKVQSRRLQQVESGDPGNRQSKEVLRPRESFKAAKGFQLQRAPGRVKPQ